MSDPAKKSQKIAVIDDEKSLLGVFSSLMGQFQFTADFFESPQAAFDKIATNPEQYRLVITDIRMAGMDGITFAKKVRFLLPKIPFIFMTGNLTPDIREGAEKLGNNIILEKPFPLVATLKETIAKLTSI